METNLIREKIFIKYQDEGTIKFHFDKVIENISNTNFEKSIKELLYYLDTMNRDDLIEVSEYKKHIINLHYLSIQLKELSK